MVVAGTCGSEIPQRSDLEGGGLKDRQTESDSANAFESVELGFVGNLNQRVRLLYHIPIPTALCFFLFLYWYSLSLISLV